ncbi:MAG TPA: PCRF domain-containing protein, partial [Armatimonadota bacterium]|nr:PCRF domain-containing protein [Armatimonadota bacterium]
MAEMRQEAAREGFWDDLEASRAHSQQMSQLERFLAPWQRMERRVAEALEMIELAQTEGDESLVEDVARELEEVEAELAHCEHALLLSGEHDFRNAYLSINAGAGGTESQDWAEMLQRMYTLWAEGRGMEVEVLNCTPGESAGIKSVTCLVKGPFAFGLLRSEVGVHRLVRLSPFDAAHRRHTSFASVDVVPELDDDIHIDISPDDLRIETYRSGGAG